jgi:hypothetical protein
VDDDDLGRLLADLTDEQLEKLGEIAQLQIFSKKQFRRAEALKVAREVLIGTSTPDRGEVAPFDLVYVAAYIENGTVFDGVVDELLDADGVPAMTPDEAAAVPPEPAKREICPDDPTHYADAHWPGGAWYGVEHTKAGPKFGDPEKIRG